MSILLPAFVWVSAQLAISSGTAWADQAPTPIWIDTDPACGTSSTHDVDDCWALMALLRSPRVAIRGISSIFGNAPGHVTYNKLIELLRKNRATVSPVVRGADDPSCSGGTSEYCATAQLAAALEKESLTIVALGPLTNIKILLERRPDLASRIDRIIAVAGQRPGQRFLTGKHFFSHVHDMNFRKDPAAFRSVLDAKIRLDLIPFELARQVVVRHNDLASISNANNEAAAWLARASKPWLSFWRRWLNEEGFFPFDSLAAGYVLNPAMFRCKVMSVRIVERPGVVVQRSTLEVSSVRKSDSVAAYCDRVAPGFKQWLIRQVR